MSDTLTRKDKEDIFSHQAENGPFSTIAAVAAGLNYMDRLNRRRLDISLPRPERRAARLRLIELEGRLFRFIQSETPLSYFDADFRKETEQYIALRTLFISASAFTFARHRLHFLIDLLRLYGDDPCRILPEREIAGAKWEHVLLHDYLLFDMSLKNTEHVGREAVSNGYHECDYTLEIEEVWKQPMKAVRRTNFRYAVQCRPYSKAAAAVIAYVRGHGAYMKKTGWTVDAAAIESAMNDPHPEPLSDLDVQKIISAYYAVL